MIASRRSVLFTLAAGAAAAGVRPVSAQQQEQLRLATFVPSTHYGITGLLGPWAQDLNKRTGGRLSVRIFPSMQLGGKPPELYRQMARGLSDITFTLPGYTSADFPLMALSELPGLAKDAFEGTRMLWRNAELFRAGEMKDAVPLVMWTGDAAAVMTRNKPIRTLEDMQGLKIRTPSAAQSGQLTALGATPIDMPAGQIYNAIERGVVDGALISMAAAIDFKLLEVCRYYTIDAPVGRSPFIVVMNRSRHEKLAPDLRKAIDETTGVDISIKAAKLIQANSDQALAMARKDREVIELSAAEQKRWTEAFGPFIAQQVAAAEKAGAPAREFVRAYGLKV